MALETSEKYSCYFLLDRTQTRIALAYEASMGQTLVIMQVPPQCGQQTSTSQHLGWLLRNRQCQKTTCTHLVIIIAIHFKVKWLLYNT